MKPKDCSMKVNKNWKTTENQLMNDLKMTKSRTDSET